MAGGVKAEILYDSLDFSSQDRDVARAAIVGGGGPQAEKPVLAVDFAALIEGFDADVVQVFASMYGRSRIRLRQDQQFVLAGARAHVAAQGRCAGAGCSAIAIAQNAESGASVGDDVGLAGAALQVVVPVAEEDEVAAFHPLEQAASFADFIGWERWGVGFEQGDNGLDLVTHASPVFDGNMDIRKRRFDLALQLLELSGVGLTVELVELPGFCVCLVGAIGAQLDELATTVAADVQHRVNNQVDCNFGPPEHNTE